MLRMEARRAWIGRVKALIGLVAVALAGCASTREPERLEVRRLAPGEELMPGLRCVSVESGATWRVRLANETGEDRAIVWFPRWRTLDGYEVKAREEKVKDLRIPAKGEATLVAEPPVPEARQLELLAGDRR